MKINEKSQIIEHVFAIIISFIGYNFTIFYEVPTGWIERGDAATSAIWNPASIIVHGTKGCGHLVQENVCTPLINSFSRKEFQRSGCSRPVGRDIRQEAHF